MTNKGHAVTNPRISAGATVVRSPRLPWGSGFVPTSSHDLEGGEFCLLDFKQPYQRYAVPRALLELHKESARRHKRMVMRRRWCPRNYSPELDYEIAVKRIRYF